MATGDSVMQTLIDLLGFTTLEGIIWNTLGYSAFIAIIIGVSSARYRYILITTGAGVLALYAGIFFRNPLLATLQVLIVISGILSIAKASQRLVVITMISLTTGAYLFLASSGAIVDAWTLIGSFGLLGIAFGLITFPKHYGFLLMATGGVLLIVYAFAVASWVFFCLNIFFAITNIRTWKKQR